MSTAITTGIITVSDRAARGEYPDLGGPALCQAAQAQGWTVRAQALVADELPAIQAAVRDQLRAGCDLILITGGTGIGARDVTPEAIRDIANRELPGFGELMRRESLKSTPTAILSRGLAAVVDRALVLCLPGKPAGAVECLGFVVPVIPHAIAILKDLPAH